MRGRGRWRFIAEIAEVTDVTETGKIAMNRIFAPAAAHEQAGWTRGAVFVMAPQLRWPFDEAGVDLGFLSPPDVDGPATDPARADRGGHGRRWRARPAGSAWLAAVCGVAAAAGIRVLAAAAGCPGRARRSGAVRRGGGGTARGRVVGDPAWGRSGIGRAQRSRWRVIAWCGVGVGGVVGDGLAGGRAGGVGHRAVGAVADGLRAGQP